MTVFEIADVIHLPSMFVQNLLTIVGVDGLSQRERTSDQSVKMISAVLMLFRHNTLTQDQFDAMMNDWLARRAALPASDWAVPYIDKAIDAGLMTEVNGSIERPQDFVTREELATVAVALTRK